MNCERIEAVRDYAFDELPAAARPELEQHLLSCEACADELRGLQFTTSALRALPDREIPQRIAFISDKVFEPSPVARFFGGFWNSGPKLGFASACLLAGAMVFSAARRPVEIKTIVQSPTAAQPAGYSTGYTKEMLDEAVRVAVAKVHGQDAAETRSELAKVEQKYDEKQRALMISVDENFQVLQKRLSSYTTLASNDASRMAGQ